jgi:hypothetical protein
MIFSYEVPLRGGGRVRLKSLVASQTLSNELRKKATRTLFVKKELREWKIPTDTLLSNSVFANSRIYFLTFQLKPRKSGVALNALRPRLWPAISIGAAISKSDAASIVFGNHIHGVEHE